MKMLVALIDS